MRDVLPTLERWAQDGVRAALATVVGVDRSAPREPGSVMAVSETGEVVGSVTGGCVEPAVYLHAEEVLAGGPARMATYGIVDEEAFEVGLPCGGNVQHLRGADGSRGGDPGRGRRARGAPRGLPHDGRRGAAGRAPGDLPRGRRRRRGGGRRPPAAGPGGERRGRGRRAGGLRVVVRVAPGHVHLRGDRLRLVPRHRGAVPGLPGHRLRPAGDLRDPRALPRRRRAGHRVAARVPGPRAGGRAHGDLRADARRQVRRARAAGRARHPGALHRRDGVAPHHRAPSRAPDGARGGRGGARPRTRSDRPVHRVAHPGGGGGRHRRADHLRGQSGRGPRPHDPLGAGPHRGPGGERDSPAEPVARARPRHGPGAAGAGAARGPRELRARGRDGAGSRRGAPSDRRLLEALPRGRRAPRGSGRAQRARPGRRARAARGAPPGAHDAHAAPPAARRGRGRTPHRGGLRAPTASCCGWRGRRGRAWPPRTR